MQRETAVWMSLLRRSCLALPTAELTTSKPRSQDALTQSREKYSRNINGEHPTIHPTLRVSDKWACLMRSWSCNPSTRSWPFRNDVGPTYGPKPDESTPGTGYFRDRPQHSEKALEK